MGGLEKTRIKDAEPAPLDTKRSKLVCASCRVTQAIQRRMVLILALAAGLTAVLTFFAIEWARMG